MIELPNGFVEKLRARIKTLFADEQSVYEKARIDILGKIESVKRKKKNLVMQLLDNEKSSPADIEMYEGIKMELNLEENRFNEELTKIENKISAVVRTVEIAVALAANCLYAFQKAKEPALQTLLARTLFKKLLMKDGEIVSAVLNEPVDYLCYPRLKNHPIFDLSAVGAPERTRTSNPCGTTS